MTAEVAVRQQPAAVLTAKMAYANQLASSGLLPAAYRKNPANVLWATEYGDMLGIAPMAAITGVHVIDGKPTASAGLISALVRRAGHKLRVRGDSKSATCEIVRSDDPDFTFAVTFTIEDAKNAGLTGKDVWKKYGASMLKSRAITQCARDACEEALFGLHYTAEELGADNVDEDGSLLDDAPQAQAQPARPAPRPAEADTDPVDAVVVLSADDVQALLARASSYGTKAEGDAIWKEVLALHQSGAITGADAKAAKDAIGTRFREITAPAPALDAEDPWAEAVEAIQGPDGVARVLSDLADSADDGKIDDAHRKRVIAAVEERAAAMTGEAAA